jgi:hypothetical protein
MADRKLDGPDSKVIAGRNTKTPNVGISRLAFKAVAQLLQKDAPEVVDPRMMAGANPSCATSLVDALREMSLEQEEWAVDQTNHSEEEKILGSCVMYVMH